MSVGILLITHDELGAVLLKSASDTLSATPLACGTLAVGRECEPEELRPQAAELAREIDSGEGLLVLTDIYGSTPGNIACSLIGRHQTRVIAGVNLPMLIRVFNYPHLDLTALAEKALSGGHDGILACDEFCYLENQTNG